MKEYQHQMGGLIYYMMVDFCFEGTSYCKTATSRQVLRKAITSIQEAI